MTWLKNIFVNNSNEEMEKEQLLYQLRQAQDDAVQMGTLISQIYPGQSNLQQMQELNQLNASVGGFLQKLRQRIDKEME